MTDFADMSLQLTVFVVALIALILGLRAWLGYRSVVTEARADYDYRAGQGMNPPGLDRDSYVALYRRVHGPRGAAHIAVGLLILLAATPLAMTVLGWVLTAVYNLSGQNRTIEPGYLVWHIMLFFGMVALWTAVAFLVARRYHARAPASLRHEIDAHLRDDPKFGETF